MSIGCVIAFQHDIADITAAMCKYFGQTVYTKMAVATFVCNMVLWAYTRNIWLSYLIYRLYTECMFLYQPPFEFAMPVLWISVIMLTMMLFLHFYWYVLFVQMMLHHARTGQAEDLQ